MSSTPRILRSREKKPLLPSRQSPYESLDYDVVESSLYRQSQIRRTDAIRKREKLLRWVVYLMIGLLTSLFAFALDVVIRWGDYFKMSFIQRLIEKDGGFWIPFLAILAIGLALVFFSVGEVLVLQPEAAGSGIPEVTGYLNGVKIRNIVRLKTLLAKVIGIIFSATSGLAIGKAGTMIHMSAIIAAGVSQFGSRSLHLQADVEVFKIFRNDHDKRDFVSCGAGCGMAAALGSPIGGMLFSLNEMSSFWNAEMTWMTFFSCMSCCFVLSILLGGVRGRGLTLELPGLIVFGSFDDRGKDFKTWEIALFVLTGVFGGVAGALFNFLNKKLAIFREQVMTTKWRKVIDALLVCLITIAVKFTTAYFYPNCGPVPHDVPNMDHFESFQRFYCKSGQYSDLASLFFTPHEDSIRNMFRSNMVFSSPSLLIFGTSYFFLCILVHGIAVPTGLFVPSIMIGAAFGRSFGSFLQQTLDLPVNVPPYALFGASAFLSGSSRLTLSLTIILIEATNAINYAFPIMVTVMGAAWMGNKFDQGLYHIFMKLKRIPFLDWRWKSRAAEELRAVDIMSSPVVFFKVVDNVGKIFNTLLSFEHNGFPIVEDDGQGRLMFRGMILRSHIMVLLHEKAFQNFGYSLVGRQSNTEMQDAVDPESSQEFFIPPRPDEDVDAGLVDCPALHDGDVEYKYIGADTLHRGMYPRPPKMARVNLSSEDMFKFIDFSPYFHPFPATVNPHCSVSRVLKTFGSGGLRHLPVVDRKHALRGIITRADLQPEFLENVYQRKKKEKSFCVQ